MLLSLAKNTWPSPAPLLDAKFDSPVFSINSNPSSAVLTLKILYCSPVKLLGVSVSPVKAEDPPPLPPVGISTGRY